VMRLKIQKEIKNLHRIIWRLEASRPLRKPVPGVAAKLSQLNIKLRQLRKQLDFISGRHNAKDKLRKRQLRSQINTIKLQREHLRFKLNHQPIIGKGRRVPLFPPLKKLLKRRPPMPKVAPKKPLKMPKPKAFPKKPFKLHKPKTAPKKPFKLPKPKAAPKKPFLLQKSKVVPRALAEPAVQKPLPAKQKSKHKEVAKPHVHPKKPIPVHKKLPKKPVKQPKKAEHKKIHRKSRPMPHSKPHWLQSLLSHESPSLEKRVAHPFPSHKVKEVHTDSHSSHLLDKKPHKSLHGKKESKGSHSKLVTLKDLLSGNKQTLDHILHDQHSSSSQEEHSDSKKSKKRPQRTTRSKSEHKHRSSSSSQEYLHQKKKGPHGSSQEHHLLKKKGPHGSSQEHLLLKKKGSHGSSQEHLLLKKKKGSHGSSQEHHPLKKIGSSGSRQHKLHEKHQSSSSSQEHRLLKKKEKESQHSKQASSHDEHHLKKSKKEPHHSSSGSMQSHHDLDHHQPAHKEVKKDQPDHLEHKEKKKGSHHSRSSGSSHDKDKHEHHAAAKKGEHRVSSSDSLHNGAKQHKKEPAHSQSEKKQPEAPRLSEDEVKRLEKKDQYLVEQIQQINKDIYKDYQKLQKLKSEKGPAPAKERQELVKVIKDLEEERNFLLASRPRRESLPQVSKEIDQLNDQIETILKQMLKAKLSKEQVEKMEKKLKGLREKRKGKFKLLDKQKIVGRSRRGVLRRRIIRRRPLASKGKLDAARARRKLFLRRAAPKAVPHRDAPRKLAPTRATPTRKPPIIVHKPSPAVRTPTEHFPLLKLAPTHGHGRTHDEHRKRRQLRKEDGDWGDQEFRGRALQAENPNVRHAVAAEVDMDEADVVRSSEVLSPEAQQYLASIGAQEQPAETQPAQAPQAAPADQAAAPQAPAPVPSQSN